jgi:hypothetical protein
MTGLVLVRFKKDCLDLPEKRYDVIYVKPTVELLRAANLLKRTSKRAIEALTLLRELSDGFQYKAIPTGKKQCTVCAGNGKAIQHTHMNDDGDWVEELSTCIGCGGAGEITTYERISDTISSPKDEIFISELETLEGIGRFIVWGGFTGTVDRLVEIAHQQGWATLRVDGRGYSGSTPMKEPLDTDELLDAMDLSHPRKKELLEKYPKLCFVGQPEAGGLALTLTASPIELFFSNSFNGRARMQAEDRGHRIGMDINRGLTIKDVVCLPTDELVLKNLQQKKRLQDLTMGQLSDALEKGIKHE